MEDLPDEALEQVAAYFQALSEPTRLRILNLLRTQGKRSFNPGKAAAMAFLTIKDPSTIKAIRTGMLEWGYKAQRWAHGLGKRFIAYLPCEVAGNLALHQGFAWNTEEGTDQAEFQRRYLLAIREWAERFGPLMDGWWFDGCYEWPIFHSRTMDWPAWFDATRAGNPDRVVAFNDGSLCNGLTQPLTPEQDYLSGETEVLVDGRIRLGRPETPQLLAYGALARCTPEPIPTFLPESRFVPGTRCQWHSLLPIDCFWGHGNGYADWLPADRYHFLDPGLTAAPMEPPLYSDDELSGFRL